MKIISLKEAQIGYAKRRLQLLDHYDIYPNYETDDADIDILMGKVSSTYEEKEKEKEKEKNQEKRKSLEVELKRYGKYLFSFPHIRNYLKVYMVDVKFGTEIPFSKEKENGNVVTEEIISDLFTDPKKFTCKTAGNLLSQIETELNELFGLKITDRGFGCGGGHIGCPCTEHEKDLIFDYIWIKYRKAIESDLIFPVVAFNLSYIKFGNLWDRKEIEDFIKENEL